MTNLFDFPEVQSFVLPVLTALLVGTAADRFGLANRGIGMLAGFIVAVLFVNGVELQPLTAARKIILAGIAAAVVGAFVDQRRAAWAGRPLYFATLGLLAGAWVLAVTLLRKSGMELLTASAGSALYTAWIVYWLDRLHNDELRATSATVSLGLGTGIAAVIGSSGLFGQLAVAVGAGAGGVMLLALLRNKNTAGSVLTLPAGVLLSLIGVSAVVFADLPWIVLAILGLIPPVAHWAPAPESWSRWRRAAFLTVLSLALAGIALAYAGYLAGSSTY